jgi:diacylglycerol kinase (ATP)
MKAAIFINYSANNHRAKYKWLQIQEKVVSLFPEKPIIVTYETPFDIKQSLIKVINENGVDFFVSAGGDGSLNYLLNALISLKGANSKAFCIGSIGLGSSNDFLKPYTNLIDDIPIKLDYKRRTLSDIGKVTFIDDQDKIRSRLFLVNASIGLTAEANLLFNKGDRLIRFMKSRFLKASIFYTAVKALLKHKNQSIRLQDGNKSKSLIISNISLTKKPYISGGFHYAQSTSHNSGKLGFYCMGELNKLELIKTMRNLQYGKFPANSKQQTSFVSNLRIESDKPLPLETDGEIQLGYSFKFTVIRKGLYLAA